MTKLSFIYNSEDESQYVMTKLSSLRIIVQLLRLKKDISDSVAESIIKHSVIMNTLTNAAFNSKDGILSATAL